MKIDEDGNDKFLENYFDRNLNVTEINQQQINSILNSLKTNISASNTPEEDE